MSFVGIMLNAGGVILVRKTSQNTLRLLEIMVFMQLVPVVILLVRLKPVLQFHFSLSILMGI